MSTPRSQWRIVPMATDHARGVADCHIECWREAYPELVPGALLATYDPRRGAEQWERRLDAGTEQVAVALLDAQVIGFASVGPPREPTVPQSDAKAPNCELRAMYIRAPWYATGLATELLTTVLAPETPCLLWVFDENPRARAFYRKHGFVPDGARRVEKFTLAVEIRMIREWRRASGTLSRSD